MTVASLRLPIRVEPLRLGFRLLWDLKLPNSLESHREEHSRELDSGKGSFSSSNDTRSIIITHMPRDPLQNRCDSLEQITVIADAPPTYLSTYSTYLPRPDTESQESNTASAKLGLVQAARSQGAA